MVSKNLLWFVSTGSILEYGADIRNKILPLILSRRCELTQTIGVDALDTLADGVTGRPGK